MSKTCTAIGAAAVAMIVATPALADSAQAEVVVSQQAGSQSVDAPAAAADPCGNHTHPIGDVVWRYWRNCITTSEKIKIDTILWPDREVRVGAGSDTRLGPVDAVRGASRVGNC